MRSLKILNDLIHHCFAMQVSKHPHRVAVTLNGQELTYQALNQRANQLAAHLLTLGIAADDRIAICMSRSMDVLVAMLAILKVGGAFVPLDPNQPFERLSFILKNSDARICIVHQELIGGFATEQAELVLYDVHTFAKYSKDDVPLPLNCRNLAYVIYTSGTTGKPKGVLIEHRSVVNYAHWFMEYAAIVEGMRVDWSSNYAFDMAVTTTIVPLMLGLTVVICEENIQRDFSAYLDHIASNKINFIKITPSYFKELLRQVKINYVELPSLSTIILGGEQLTVRDCTHWLTIYNHHVLFNEYGPTEATVAFSQFMIAQNTNFSQEVLVPIGFPGNNMYHYIFDKQGQLAACGEEGELYIGGIGLARGYLNLPEQTADCFVPHPFIKGELLYKTGDLCRTLANGMLEYLGRMDRQVKIRGFRVELNEVEQILTEHPAIQDAVVFVRENPQQGKQLVAYYIPENAEKSLDTAELREFLLKKIPYYMIPVVMLPLHAFPMTSNGKLDESIQLKELIQPPHEKPPQSHLEKVILKIWSKELGVSSLHIDQNFWELGGHSFIAARILSQINETLAINIMPQQFVDALTVRDLVEITQTMLQNKPEKQHKQLNSFKKTLPLSDFQTIIWACKTFKPKAAKLNIIARKRFQGEFDANVLRAALACLIKKHAVLSYRIAKFIPVQRIEQLKPSHLVEHDLSMLAEEEVEYVLWSSMDDLAKFQAWKAKTALIRCKLFQLAHATYELQIAVPHIIADGLSIDIIFAELSEFYLHCKSNAHVSSYDFPQELVQYSDYVVAEHLNHKDRVRQDLDFWVDYLKNAHLFAFPSQYVVQGESQPDFVYSTYVPIPSKAIQHLEVFCMRQHVHLNEAVSSVLARALINCLDEAALVKNTFLINVIKSARDSLIYDETIGCFIRVEPLKFVLNKAQTLLNLLSQVQAFKTKHLAFQQSLSLLKLVSLNRFYRRRKGLKYYFAGISIFLYRKLLRLFDLNHDMLKLFPDLSLLDDKKNFTVYLNIWSNFVNDDRPNKQLFGLPMKTLKMYQYDLLSVDYLFETCFLRDENNQPFVVISSNLTPYYRNKIAHEIIRIMQEEMVDLTTGAATVAACLP